MKRIIPVILATLLIGFSLGWWVFGTTSPSTKEERVNEEKGTSFFTCSMHPDVRQEDPGDCPICGMDLVQESSLSSETSGSGVVFFDKETRRSLSIETYPVQKRDIKHTVSMLASSRYDDAFTLVVPTPMKARVEQRFVPRVGSSVKKGQLLATLYAPEWLNFQQELRSVPNNQFEGIRNRMKQKLKQWNIDEVTIENVFKSDSIRTILPIYAPIDGILTTRMPDTGGWLKENDPLFFIQNEQIVLIEAELRPEHHIHLFVGDRVSIYQGVQLMGTGTIIEITTVSNKKGRSGLALILPEETTSFFPEMVFRVERKVTLQKQLVIPNEAIMWTGSESVVYIEDEAGHFHLREIEYGQRFDQFTTVKKGLAEGETVVSNGTFLVDASAQLLGYRSMMNVGQSDLKDTSDEKDVSNPTPFDWNKENIALILPNYLKLKETLVASDFNRSKQVLDSIRLIFEESDVVSKNEWKVSGFESLYLSSDLESLRERFSSVSANLIKAMNQLPSYSSPLYIQYCPMAKSNKGAFWISTKPVIENPYYGDMMLRCGEVIETFFTDQ